MSGVSLAALSEWWSKQPQALLQGKESWTTAQVCSDIVLTETAAAQCSLLEKFEKEDPESVNECNVFVSHAWNNKFDNLINALLDARIGSEASTFLWLDIVVINQHKAAQHAYDQDFWTRSFHDSIRKIGNTILILEPWENPLPLTRCWCLWEIYGSIHVPKGELASKPKFSVALSTNQKAQFLSNLVDEFDKILKNLSSIDARNAEAFDPADKEAIFAAIEKTVGFDQLNQEVIGELRNWLINSASKYVDDMESVTNRRISHVGENNLSKHDLEVMQQLAIGCVQVGQLNQHLNQERKAYMYYERAAKWLSKLRKLSNATDDQFYLKSLATVLTNCGLLTLNLSRENQMVGSAVQHFDAAKKCYIELNGTKSSALARTLNNLGMAYKADKMYKKAIKSFEESIAMKKDLAKESEDEQLGIELGVGLNNCATVFHAMGDNEKAIENCREALLMLEQELGQNHPNVATALANLAVCLLDSCGPTGDPENPQLQMNSDDNQLLLKLQPPNTSEENAIGVSKLDDTRGASSVDGILQKLQSGGSSESKQFVKIKGEHPLRAEAEALLNRAVAIDKKVYGTEHRKVPSRLYFLSRAMWEQGNLEGALQVILESNKINQSLKCFGWSLVDSQVIVEIIELMYESRKETANEEDIAKYEELYNTATNTIKQHHRAEEQMMMTSNLFVPRSLNANAISVGDWNPVTQEGLAIISRPSDIESLLPSSPFLEHPRAQRSKKVCTVS